MYPLRLMALSHTSAAIFDRCFETSPARVCKSKTSSTVVRNVEAGEYEAVILDADRMGALPGLACVYFPVSVVLSKTTIHRFAASMAAMG